MVILQGETAVMPEHLHHTLQQITILPTLEEAATRITTIHPVLHSDTQRLAGLAIIRVIFQDQVVRLLLVRSQEAVVAVHLQEEEEDDN